MVVCEVVIGGWSCGKMGEVGVGWGLDRPVDYRSGLRGSVVGLERWAGEVEDVIQTLAAA